MALMPMACGTIWKRKLLKKCKEVFDEKEEKNLNREEQQTERAGDNSEQGRWEGRCGLACLQ